MCRVFSNNWGYIYETANRTLRRLTSVLRWPVYIRLHLVPEVARYGRTTTEAGRKYVASKRKLRTGLRPEIGQWWKTIENSSIVKDSKYYTVTPSVAYILDPVKFNGSSGSSEKDAGREPAPVAAAAGHSCLLRRLLLIFRKLCWKMQIVVTSELVQAFNLRSLKMTAMLDAILNLWKAPERRICAALCN